MKKKRFAMLAVMLLTIVICILMTGCGSGKARTESQMKRVAADLLEEKYDEEFEIHYAWPRDSSLFYATCSPKSNPEIVFEMQAYKDGSELYEDGYVKGLVAQQIRDKITLKLATVFEDSYVKVTFSDMSPSIDYTDNITINDYYNEYPDASFYLQVIVDKEKLDNSTECIQKEYELLAKLLDDEVMKEAGCRCYFVDSVQLNECKKYFQKENKARGEFDNIIADVSYFGFGFLEGNINTAYADYEMVRKGMTENE